MTKYSRDRLAGASVALLWAPLMIAGLVLLDGLDSDSHRAGGFSVAVTTAGVFGVIVFRVFKQQLGNSSGGDTVRPRVAFWSSAIQVAVLLILLVALDLGSDVAGGTSALLWVVLLMGLFMTDPRQEKVTRRRDKAIQVFVPLAAVLGLAKLTEAVEPMVLLAAGLHAGGIALMARNGRTTAAYGASAMTFLGLMTTIVTLITMRGAFGPEAFLRGGAAGLVLGAAAVLAWWCLRRVQILTFAVTSLGGLILAVLCGGFGFERPGGPLDWIALSALALSVGGAVWTAARDR